jgi:hypothetical protein
LKLVASGMVARIAISYDFDRHSEGDQTMPYLQLDVPNHYPLEFSHTPSRKPLSFLEITRVYFGCGG